VKRFIKRIRGILGTGITWAIGWGATFVGLRLVLSPGHFTGLAALAVSGMGFGFVAGSSFAVILSITERRRSLHQLSLRRVALWGGIGGAMLALLAAPRVIGAGLPLNVLVSAYLIPLGLTGLLGAGFAAGSVAIARKGDQSLIEGDGGSVPSLEEERMVEKIG